MKKLKNMILWAFIILGGMFAYEGISDTIDSKKTPVDFASLMESNLSAGMIVEGDLPGNYGAFEEEYHTTYGIKTGTTDYTYLISIGNQKYMGIKSTSTEQVTALNTQANATVDYILGDSSIAPTPFHFKGKIIALTTEEQNFMKAYLKEMGYTEQELPGIMVNYKIQCVELQNGLITALLGTLSFLLGVFFLTYPWIEEQRHQRNFARATAALSEREPVYKTEPEEPLIFEEPTHTEASFSEENSSSIYSSGSGLSLKKD